MDGSGGEDQEGNGEKEGHFKDGAGGLLMFFIEKQKTRTKKKTHTHAHFDSHIHPPPPTEPFVFHLLYPSLAFRKEQQNQIRLI